MNLRNLRGRVGKLFVGGAIATMPFSMTSCDEATTEAILEALSNVLGLLLSPADVTDVPEDAVYDGGGSLPSNVDWSVYSPAVGNQGSYGTCVAWATGYGLKTTLNNIDAKRTNGKNTASLQTSPVDLWHLMRSSYSSATSNQCGGSSFDPAFKVMIDKGVTTMDKKPFTNQKMQCDGASPTGNVSNKLGAYRLVAYTRELSGTSDYGMTVDNIRAKLSEGPLVVGAKLGERFMGWSSSATITADDPSSYNGGHAYHAMLITGYDDSRSAFRIQNSWGSSEWGDNGFIWVNYDFFIKNFAFGVWSASNDADAYASKTASNLRSATGVDLEVKVVSDVPSADGKRVVTYDIVNKGQVDVDLSDCDVVYSIFRAKKFHSKSILADVKLNATVPAGSTASAVLGKNLTIEYQIPSVLNDVESDGNCYLFMALDPKNNAEDSDLSNNFAFITSSDAKPLTVSANSIADETNVLYADLSSKIRNEYSGSELIGRLAKELK